MSSEAVKHGLRNLFADGAILAISATVVAAWVFAKPIVFSSESVTYINLARELELGNSTAQPLFPAILWAFHITDLKHSVFGLIILHALLAVASCWLFYLTVRLVEPRGAFVLSLIFIGSLLPFLNVKYIVTDQIFLFESLLVLYGIVAYLTAQTARRAVVAIAILGVGVVLMTL